MNGKPLLEADFESITDVFEEIDHLLPADIEHVDWDGLDPVTRLYAVQNLIALRDAAATAILSLTVFLDLIRPPEQRAQA